MRNFCRDYIDMDYLFIRFNSDSYENKSGEKIKSYTGRKKKLIDYIL